MSNDGTNVAQWAGWKDAEYQMTHPELVRELRRLRVLVSEMSEKLRAAGGDDE